MSEAMFDKQSWQRALGPAIRAMGYFSVIVLSIFILIIAPLSLIQAPTQVWAAIQLVLPFVLVFAFFLVIFKVFDELRSA